MMIIGSISKLKPIDDHSAQFPTAIDNQYVAHGDLLAYPTFGAFSIGIHCCLDLLAVE